MKKLWLMAALAVSTAVLPAIAQAAPAISTGNVNMRSGPSTRYPAVIVIPVGSRVDIRGCMSSANWCDVAFAGYRGWVSGTYLQASVSQRRVYVDPQYYRPLGIPTVTFSVGRYWDDHYRNRPFYRDRDRWRDNDGPRGNDRPRFSNGPRGGDNRPDSNDRPRGDDPRNDGRYGPLNGQLGGDGRDDARRDNDNRRPDRRMMRDRCARDPSACE